MRGFLRENKGRCFHIIGGRRLGAWEAVVFGEPRVENALTTVIGDGHSVSYLHGERDVSGYADLV
jgi:hypothetical protein